MAYTSDKKPNALTAATSVAAGNEIVVSQAGVVNKATMTQVESFIFSAKTQVTPNNGDIVVVRRGSDIRQMPVENMLPAGSVTNAMLAGSITNAKLNTISDTGKVDNSATTATSTNTNNAIVTRDGSGNFSAGTITATLAGSSTNVVDGAITNAKVASNAAIAGTKIVSNFGSQTVTGSEIISLAAGGEGGQLTLQNAAGDAIGSFIDIDSNNLLRIFNAQNTPTIFVTNNVERMRIAADGNVGIGTNNPIGKLHVVNGRTFLVSQSGDGYVLNLRSAGIVDGCWITNPAEDTLGIASSGGTERMRIDASGNVGIGTTTMSQRLNVEGSIHLGPGTGFRYISTTSEHLAFVKKTGGPFHFYFRKTDDGTAGGANSTDLFNIKDTGQVRFIPLSADPAGAESGDVYYNSVGNKLKVYGGSSWIDINYNGWATKTANYTAVAGDRISANTSGGAFTITLPATPATYTEVILADHAGTWATNNLTVARNGQNINGGAADLICDVSAKQIILRFEPSPGGGSTGWRIYT